VSDVTTNSVNAADNSPKVMVFVSDEDSMGVIRQSLADVGLKNVVFVPGDVTTATAAMAQGPSPRILIVDISKVDDPSARISELAGVCEPGIAVIVIGTDNDIRLYRGLKAAGVAEYFFKPLVRNVVARACDAILKGAVTPPATSTGRLVLVLGVRGGVGATTIAVTTAWQMAEVHKRWVMLLDADLCSGDAALQFDKTPSHALAEAIMRPDRVDELFLERGAIHVAPRLDLLASLEPFADPVVMEEPALLSLLETLLRRYRFVFVDVPAMLALKLNQMLHLPSLCVLVSNGTLAAARDVGRWYEKIGPNTAERSTIHILNQSGAVGSLPEAEFVRAAGKAPDLIIPYHRDIATASNLGIKGIQNCGALEHALGPLLRQLAGEVEIAPRSFFNRLFG
jgi:pilus assembly protein CpaE